jgi:rod shape-determining protein MreD
MRRVLVLSATMLLLWTVASQVNHVLSSFRFYVYVGGLFVTYAALTQPMRHGIIASVLGGLFCDLNGPADLFGTQALLFAAAHVSVFHIRDRIPRDETASRVVVALLSNLAVFLALSFSQIHLSPAPAAAWPRLLTDLVCSQIFIAIVAPWFFALQVHALILARVDRQMLA